MRAPHLRAARALENLQVALYARVSSDQQAEHHTIDSQLAELTARVTQDGHSVRDDLRFIDNGHSVSGGEKLPHGSGRFVWLRRRKIPSPVYLPADLNGRKGEDEASGAVCTGTACVPC